MTTSRDDAEPVTIGGYSVRPGKRRRFDLPVGRLPMQSLLEMPVMVVNGRRAGPRLWLSAAVHGDELNGLEVIWRILERVEARSLCGTVVAVPVVNVFGIIRGSRYLPDRRDLNRSFPGSPRGSLAARLAHLFLTEIVRPSTHGIDLHTGSLMRENLPQVRGDLDDPRVLAMAEAFGAPVMVDARPRRGSLRATAADLDIPNMIFEGGEGMRFQEDAIEAGVTGVLSVMHRLGMLDRAPAPFTLPVRLDATRWVRARRGGILRMEVGLGAEVAKGEVLGRVADAFGKRQATVRAPFDGIVIGRASNPLVHQGDAVAHIGRLPA